MKTVQCTLNSTDSNIINAFRTSLYIGQKNIGISKVLITENTNYNLQDEYLFSSRLSLCAFTGEEGEYEYTFNLKKDQLLTANYFTNDYITCVSPDEIIEIVKEDKTLKCIIKVTSDAAVKHTKYDFLEKSFTVDEKIENTTIKLTCRLNLDLKDYINKIKKNFEECMLEVS